MTIENIFSKLVLKSTDNYYFKYRFYHLYIVNAVVTGYALVISRVLVIGHVPVYCEAGKDVKIQSIV